MRPYFYVLRTITFAGDMPPKSKVLQARISLKYIKPGFCPDLGMKIRYVPSMLEGQLKIPSGHTFETQRYLESFKLNVAVGAT